MTQAVSAIGLAVVAAVVWETAVVVNSQAGVTFHVVFYALQWTNTTSESKSSSAVSFDAREPVFKIWKDNHEVDTKTNMILYSELVDQQTEAIVSVIKKEFNEVDEEALSSFMIKYLETYYGIKK